MGWRGWYGWLWGEEWGGWGGEGGMAGCGARSGEDGVERVALLALVGRAVARVDGPRCGGRGQRMSGVDRMVMSHDQLRVSAHATEMREFCTVVLMVVPGVINLIFFLWECHLIVVYDHKSIEAYVPVTPPYMPLTPAPPSRPAPVRWTR